jgi:hypothetical protein
MMLPVPVVTDGPVERKNWYRRVQRHYVHRRSKAVIPHDSLLKGVHFGLKSCIPQAGAMTLIEAI